MTPAARYFQGSRRILARVEDQLPEIRMAARWFAETILQGRMVHLFGSGHSRILVEEMWPRYGSFPGFNPIVELSLSFHNLVVGSNGQRQAMFLENVPGLAARILRNFDISPDDCAMVASSSGCNVVPIEMAEEFRRRRVRVVAVISRQHSEKSRSAREDGRRLQDFADLVLDTGAPVGDAMVHVEGLSTPVAPGSTVGGCLLVNAIKAELADRLTRAGEPPTVLTAAALVGREKATEIFEAAYDEHARRMARLYAHQGEPKLGPSSDTARVGGDPRRDGRGRIQDAGSTKDGVEASPGGPARNGGLASWSPGDTSGERRPHGAHDVRPGRQEERQERQDRHARRGRPRRA